MKIQGPQIATLNEFVKALEKEPSLYVSGWRKAIPTGFLRSLQFWYLLTRYHRGIFYVVDDGKSRSNYFSKKSKERMDEKGKKEKGC